MSTVGWPVVLWCGAGCFACKFAGFAMPARWFERPKFRRGLELMPVALLAALIVVEAVAKGRHYDVDAARLAAVAVAAIALWRKAPFIVVVLLAAATAALLRLV